MSQALKNITARLQGTTVKAAPFKELGDGIYVVKGEVEILSADAFERDETLESKWDGVINGYDTKREAVYVVFKGTAKKIGKANSYRAAITFMATKLNLSGSRALPNNEDEVTFVFSKGDTHTVIAIDND